MAVLSGNQPERNLEWPVGGLESLFLLAFSFHQMWWWLLVCLLARTGPTGMPGLVLGLVLYLAGQPMARMHPLLLSWAAQIGEHPRSKARSQVAPWTVQDLREQTVSAVQFTLLCCHTNTFLRPNQEKKAC